uniref:Uncharacterized protein n=1 Tax=Anopheles culicifacies TaxID=139723 RepID=A0A182LXF7_9DIPT
MWNIIRTISASTSSSPAFTDAMEDSSFTTHLHRKTCETGKATWHGRSGKWVHKFAQPHRCLANRRWPQNGRLCRGWRLRLGAMMMTLYLRQATTIMSACSVPWLVYHFRTTRQCRKTCIRPLMSEGKLVRTIIASSARENRLKVCSLEQSLGEIGE